MKKTTNYDQFKKRKDNRNRVCEKHVQQIVESFIEKNDFDTRPILVNSDFEILDGNHRLEAARRLKIPVYYVVKENFDAYDIIRMNLQRSWKFDDYINFYFENGYPAYIELKKWAEEKSVKIENIIFLILKFYHQHIDDLKKGKLKFNRNDFDNSIDAYKKIITLLEKLRGNHSFFYTNNFFKGLMTVITHKHFVLSNMLKKIELLSMRVNRQASPSLYVELFMEIYNYRVRDHKL